MNGIVAIVVAELVLAVAAAEDWPRWRGPEGRGVCADSPLPLRWSTTENVRWKVQVPGEGFSSPIAWQDQVFVTSAADGGTRRSVHCIDRRSGRTLWSRSIEHADPERTSAMTGHAASTPATDGRRVVAFFGNAGAVCYDLAGRLLWQRQLGTFDTELGLASSPVIHRDRVILVCDHDGDRFTSFDSFLICLDVKTGDVVWKSDRPGLLRSWSTPVLVPAGEWPELVVNAQDELRGYDPETGEVLWRVTGMSSWVAPSPVFGRGIVLACSSKDGPTLAVRLGGRGDVTDTHVIWKSPRGAPYVSSPLLDGDFLYVATEQGILTCRDARTGAGKYQQRLEGKFYSSPVSGDGRVYLTNDAGMTFVVATGPQFELLARNSLDEYTLASPAFSGGELFIRTERHLYCVHEQHGE